LSLLEDWAQCQNVSIKAVTPDAAATNLESLPDCQLVLLNLGSQSIDDDNTRHLMKLLGALTPEMPLAIVSDSCDPHEVTTAFRSGACGFIPTSLKPSVALHAFTFIMNGGTYFPPSALLPIAELQDGEADAGDGAADAGETGDETAEIHTVRRNGKCGDPRIVRLTARQHEVLEQLRDGKSNKVIARALDMTEATVKVHVRQIMRKLGASNRTQAAVCAVQADLSGPGHASSNGISNGAEPDSERHGVTTLYTTISGAA